VNPDYLQSEVRATVAGMAVSDSDLEDLLESVARIIDRYGDVYWPIFDRLEAELSVRQSKTARLRA